MPFFPLPKREGVKRSAQREVCEEAWCPSCTMLQFYQGGAELESKSHIGM